MTSQKPRTTAVSLRIVFLFLFALLVMLLVGAAHSGSPAIPAIGYWPTFALIIAARIALFAGREGEVKA